MVQPDMFIDARDRLIIRDEPKLRSTLAALPQDLYVAAYFVKRATGMSYASLGRLREMGVLSAIRWIGPKGSPRYKYQRESVVNWIRASFVAGQY